MQQKVYYVYEWIRLDTNEPFYIGKGKDDRCYCLSRNKHFNDLIKYCDNNSIEFAVNILINNLTEKEAFEYECWYINEYIVNMGFNLTNKTWGGEGGNSFLLMTEEQKEQYRTKMRLSMLGKNTGIKPQYIRDKISKTKKEKGIARGSSNPMYGKSATDFMTEEQIIKWKENISKALKGRTYTDETRRKLSQSNKIKVIATLNNQSMIFNSIDECKQYFKNKYNIGYRSIQKIISSNKPYTSSRDTFKPLHGLRIEKYTEME